MISQTKDITLPTLRPDIEIYSGPLEDDGSPSFIVYDPLTGKYNKIGWGEAAVLNRLSPGKTLSGLLNEISNQTTLHVTREDVISFCEDISEFGLTIESQIKPAKDLIQQAKEKSANPFSWMLSHYLYFRIPLVRPDAFLTRLLPLARLLAGKKMIFLYCLFGCIGIYILSQRFENYVSTFVHFFSAAGFISYFTTIIILKTTHEFGHAFVAKHYGVRVPEMGIAFMVFAPVAYSDVTDAWRLRNRFHRLNIALAGIKVELVICVFSLVLWGITSPGIVNSIAFLLSSTTFISTIAVNLNPAMRFDGYYILSDWWGIDNLSSQATEYTKWVLRRHIFGLDIPCPVTTITKKKRFQLFFYSIYSWHYRLFLYLGIAILVYYKFTKTLGIFLFVVEIVIFIIRPIYQEIKVIMKMKEHIRFNKKMAIVIGLLSFIILWALIPMPRSKKAPAILLPSSSQKIYSPGPGRVAAVFVKPGQPVAKGDPLIQMDSEALNTEIRLLSVQIKQYRHRIELLNRRAEYTEMIPEEEKQLAGAEEELLRQKEIKDQYSIKAKVSGVIVKWDELLSKGVYIKGRQELGKISSVKKVRIDAFISEKEVNHIKIGQEVTFYPADHSRKMAGKIIRVDPIREESVLYLDIGAVASKELPLIKDPSSDKLILKESYFRVHVSVDDTNDDIAHLGVGGTIRYKTKYRSLLWELVLYCYSVIIRESSF